MKTILYSVYLGFFIFSGCVYGPKLKNKTSYLNQESYQNSSVLMTFKTKKRESIVTGRVIFSSTKNKFMYKAQSPFKIILSNKSDQTIAGDILGKSGNFRFKKPMPNGSYQIKIIANDRVIKTQKFTLNGYSKESIEILL